MQSERIILKPEFLVLVADDGGAVFEADVVNKGDHLEVTVTQSSYKDAVGSVQSFYKADDPR